MQPRERIDPASASHKYDLITALGCHALAGGRSEQTSALRLITLITARYDWTRGSLTVGQREIARLWSVDERTVKREMAKLRAAGWLVLKSPARRGRVASYGLDLGLIKAATDPSWLRVGPDFDLRMRGSAEPITAGNVISFTASNRDAPAIARSPNEAADSDWSIAREILRRDDPNLFCNWMQALTRKERAGGHIVFGAPGAFHANYVRTHLAGRILSALRSADPDIHRLTIEG